MYKLLFMILAIFIVHTTFGQVCTHVGLSKKYNFKVSLNRPTPGAENEIITVVLSVVDKVRKKQIQNIVIKPTYLFSDVFVNCNSVRSYTTGLNKNMESIDNDFGDLIVADFNFDSKEDFALKKDSGGNGGPVYNFYIQNADGSFTLDNFLSEQMEFFPTRINKSNRTLITLVHANAYELAEHTYKKNVNGNKWKEIKHRFITVH